MTHTIQTFININGESREVHLQYRTDAREALHEAMRCLSRLRPHGRDYPGLNERYEADVAEHQRRYNELTTLWNALTEEVVAIQREGGA